MEVMRLAAEAVGSIYRQVDAHSGPDACSCGWRPQETDDVGVLCAALMSAYGEHGLRNMQIAGTA
jgi:hypothetical protein